MDRSRSGFARLGLAILVFVASVVEICCLHERQVLLTFLLIATAVFMLWVSEDRWNAAIVGAIGAVLGGLGEISAVHFGVWQYPAPFVFGIPIWVPFAWGLITMVIIGASGAVGKLLKRAGRDVD